MKGLEDTTGVEMRLRVKTRLAVLRRGTHQRRQPLNVPSIPASNFRAAVNGAARHGAARHGAARHEYSRDDGTPSRDALERCTGDAGAATVGAVGAAVRVVTHPTSLDGVASTIERRAKLPGQAHVPAGLLRLSVGGEHVEDSWTDFLAALDATAAEAGADATAPPTARQDITVRSQP